MHRREFSITSRWIVLSFLFFFAYLSGFIALPESASTQKRRVIPPKTTIAPHNQIEKQAVIAAKDVSSITSTNQKAGEWGVAKQLDEHTWTMKVGDDEQMATPQEILTALNFYRNQHGRGSLAWDGMLSSYADTRAAFFTNQGTLDGHAGFQDYLENQDGFNKLGFVRVGENSSYGYRLAGVHLIEWVYAGDADHDKNQLDSHWYYVGIGVSGTATDLIFGGEKL